MEAEKLQAILGYLVFGLFALNILLTAAKSLCDKIVETFKSEGASKAGVVIAKIAAIVSKILEFVSANSVPKKV